MRWVGLTLNCNVPPFRPLAQPVLPILSCSSSSDAKAVANTYKSKYTETSAALNHNVDELLVGILTQIRLKLQTQVKVSSHWDVPSLQMTGCIG